MDPLFATTIFVLGLCFGSFLNVCIHRLPRRIEAQDLAEDAREHLKKLQSEAAPEAQVAAKQAEVDRRQKEAAGFSVVHPQSACPKCHEPIRSYDNIPVISWLALGGKCRNCRTAISPRYIAVEVLTGLLFFACYAVFRDTPTFYSFYTPLRETGAGILTSVLPVIKYCAFSFLIVGLTFIDAEWKLLPDAFTIPGLVVGLVFSLFVPVYDLFSILIGPLIVDSHWPFRAIPTLATMLKVFSLSDSVLGAVMGAGFFYFIAIAYKRVRGREGMGLGDVKLMAMVGAFLGVRLTMLTIFGASLAGSIVGLVTILIVWNRRTERRMAKCREPREIARTRAWRSAKLMYRYYGLPFGVFLGPAALLSLFFGNMFFRFYWSGF